MIRVYQDKSIFSDGYGSCYNACIASIFELSDTEIPAIYPNTTGDWGSQWRHWLAERNKKSVYCYRFTPVPDGYGIGIVETCQVYPPHHPKSGKAITHAVVVKDKKIIHDPSPSPQSYLKIKYCQIFVDMTEAEIKQHRQNGPGCIHGYRKYCETCKD